MKQILIPALICCALPLGCQSASLSPSRFTSSLFGPKKSEHTLAQSTTPTGSTTQNAQSEFGKGEEALRKGDLNGAKKHFNAVVQQAPEHVGAHHRLAYIADQTGDFTIAEIHYLSAHRIDPKNVDVLCDWGYSYLLQDRLADSRRYLEKALAIDPQHKATLLNLASLHGKQGDYDGALALFRQAGPEQEAQANIARLFPQGRPAGGTQLAQSKAPEQDISPATRDLQRKLAQSRQTQATAQHHAPQPYPVDLTQMDPRDIPPEKINEVFAQIDQQYERKYHQPEIETVNHTEPFPAAMSSPAPQSVQTIPTQPVSQLPAGPSSLPGDLPTTRAADPMQDTAVLGLDQPVSSMPPGLSSPVTAASNSPYFQTPPAQPQVSTQQNFNQPPWMNTQQITPPAGNLPPTAQSAPIAEPPIQIPPSRNPAGGLNLTGPATLPASNSDKLSYEQVMAKALLLGMSAGPGQMFPVTENQTSAFTPAPSGLSDPLLHSPAVQSGAGLIPAMGQSDHVLPSTDNSLLQMRTQAPAAVSPPPAFTVTPTGTQQPAASASGAMPADWPYAEQQVQRPIQQTSGETTNSPASATPWFNSSAPQTTNPNGGNSLPETYPAASYQTPQQWPYAPQQTSPAPAGNAQPQLPIHRGSAAATPANPASNALPQVVPGAR